MPENNRFDKLNDLVCDLNNAQGKKEILLAGLDTADEIMHILGIPYDQLDKGEEALDKAIPSSSFKNQKMEQWFEKHPYIGNSRLAIHHYNKGVYPIESMFYVLSDAPRKEKISATTQLFPNWEDSVVTMIPTYKVGVDFFLCPKTRSLLFVISRKTNLRVMEISEKLTHTQIEIFNKIQNVALTSGLDKTTGRPIPFEPQKTIHTVLWDALALKEVNKKFYIGISDHFLLLCQHLSKYPPEGVSKEEAKEACKIFSNRLIGRLLFVWFLRKKGIINPKLGYFDVEGISSSEYYETKLKKLFFETLNTPVSGRKGEGADLVTPYLNGGLFEPHKSDWYDRKIEFPEGWFVTLYNHLNEFNFTTDESSTEYEQVAIDPEMLGRVFENLLASIVPETKDAANERSKKGAFYTPREIVGYMCRTSLKEYLKRHAETDKDYGGIDKLIDLSDSDFLAQKSTGTSDLWGARSPVVRPHLIDALNSLKILDPACGSGAFPIGMLQLLLKTYDRLSAFYDPELGKMRPIRATEHNDLYQTKLFIIRNSLYGVDIEPMAIEISRLRAWLSLIIDDKKEVEPLPNLDFNFVCGNTLIRLKEAHSLFFSNEAEFEADYDKLIKEYFNTHDYEQKQLLRTKFKDLLDSLNPSASWNTGVEERLEHIRSWNPFDTSKAATFFDQKTMLNVDKFDLVIGNPPYVQLQFIQDKVLKKAYEKAGFESFSSKGDLYCLFIEKGICLLKEHGILTFITSNKWMRGGYGQNLRAYLSKFNPLVLVDFAGTKVFDSATVDTDILMVANEKNMANCRCCEIKDRNEDESKENLNAYVLQNSVCLPLNRDSAWSIVNQIDSSIKSKIEKYGIPLSKWNITIKYGVKSGLKDAFIINGLTRERLISEDPNSADLIHPVLRGRDIERYGYHLEDKWLICTFPSKNININDYPGIKKYLESFDKRKLEQTGTTFLDKGKKVKSRKKTGNKWFETQDSIVYWRDFARPKIMYKDICQRLSFCFVNDECYCDNTVYFIADNPHLLYLLGCLNSNLIDWYYRNISVQLGADGVRMFSIYVNKLPIPIVSQPEEEDFTNHVNLQDYAYLEHFLAAKFHLTDEELQYIQSKYN